MIKTKLSIFLIAASMTLSTQSLANATTTIGLQDFNGTLIDNKWQDFTAFGFGILQTSAPYSKTTSDGAGEITLSPIVDFNDNSHIHVNGGDGNPATPTTPFIHGDVGGVFLDGSDSHDIFSFRSMHIEKAILQSDTIGHPNATVTIRGFLGGHNGMMDGTVEADGTTMLYKGGAQVAEATINNGFSGTLDLLSLHSGFGEVDYVEFFFTDFYRIKPSSLGDTALDFEFDDIVIGSAVSSVPVPAAVWLFGTGLLGLISHRRKKA